MNEVEIIYEKQKEYAYIKEITICRSISGEECEDFSLKMTLSDYPCWYSDDQFNILFKGVKNLKLGDIDNLYRVCIDIKIIVNLQYENIRYSVCESENELFSFLCYDIQIC